MLTVKVKGKTIVKIAVMMIFLGIAFYGSAPQIIYDRAQSLSSAGKSKEAQQDYNVIAKYFSHSQVAAKALYFSAQIDTYGSGEGGIIYIFPRSSGMSGQNASKKDLIRAIKKFKRVAGDYPASPWGVHALRELGSTYYKLGDYNNATVYLKQLIEKSGMNEVESIRLLAKIYLQMGENEKALDLVSNSITQTPTFNHLEMLKLKGEALINLGRYQEAEKVFIQLSKKAENDLQENLKEEDTKTVRQNIDHWQIISEKYLTRLDNLRDSRNEDSGEISGKVLKANGNLSNVTVYLINVNQNEVYYTGDTEALPKAITDDNGGFVFKKIPSGTYALGLGVDLESIDGYTFRPWTENIELKSGEIAHKELSFVSSIKLVQPKSGAEFDEKITFEWEPVKGAERYDVFLGPITRDTNGRITSTYTTILRADLNTNHFSFNLKEEIKKNEFSKSMVYTDGNVHPLSILGSLYYGGEYTWGVRAYDSEGRQLSSSNGYKLYKEGQKIPVFQISDQNLSTADKLLLKGKYSDAVEEYKSQLKNHPTDKHILLVLARINYYGYDGKKDPHTAAEYYEQLRDLEDSFKVKEALADAYYAAGDYRSAYNVYQNSLDDEKSDWSINYKLGKTLVQMGEPQEALRIFEMTSKIVNGSYMRAYPVAVAVLLDERNTALSLASKMDGGERYYGLLQQYFNKDIKIGVNFKSAIINGNYKAAMEALTDSDLSLFLQALLRYITEKNFNHEKIKALKALTESINDPILKNLLSQMFINQI